MTLGPFNLLDIQQTPEKANTKADNRDEHENQQQGVAGDRGGHGADITDNCSENLSKTRNNLSHSHSYRLFHSEETPFYPAVAISEG